MMQALERAAAVFCTACICAELLSRFVGQGWGQKCIKAVAGLYILVVFADALPGAKAQFAALELPQVPAVSLGSLEDAVLAQTAEELSRALEERCLSEAGVLLRLNIILRQTSEGVEAAEVQIVPQDAVTASQKRGNRSAAGRTASAKTGMHQMEQPQRGGCAMNNELFSRLKDLAQKENRARLAVLLGAAAMLLILLSELFTPSEKTAAASAAPADDNVYRQQLEQQLSDLIAQVEGAGKTTVMITLESGEETIYALDTLSGQTQEQQTHVLLDDGTALAQTVCTPRVCGVAVVCEGGGDVRVAARITELVGALLDVPSNRICVEQRRE